MAKKEFAEKLKLFSEQVEAAQQAQTWQGHDAAAEVYEELMATLEKMYTAEEEMRQQQESLDQTEASLWKAHHHYHDLFESAPLGYLVTDAQGVIYETNRAAAALLHTEPMHLIGKP